MSDVIDLNKIEYQRWGTRLGDAILHLSLARSSAHTGNFNQARISYPKAVESWRQANESESGKWEREHELTKSEFAAFVTIDPVYNNGITSLLPIIQATPGILQMDIYKAFPSIERETISYILYFAASSGVISRVKKGRTYELRANRAD